jgi:hypothetical protein
MTCAMDVTAVEHKSGVAGEGGVDRPRPGGRPDGPSCAGGPWATPGGPSPVHRVKSDGGVDAV